MEAENVSEILRVYSELTCWLPENILSKVIMFGDNEFSNV